MKKHFINKNLAGFVVFYFALCLILVYSNIVRTHERLLTCDLHIRNTDPCFHLVSCYKKHFFRSQMKNAVSYMWDVTVYQIRTTHILTESDAKYAQMPIKSTVSFL